MRTYLDHAASTPVRESARDAFLSALSVAGNPSSVHRDGQAAKAIVEDARARVAQVFSCDPIEVVFTSGGTESVNLGLTGLYRSRLIGLAGGGAGQARNRVVVPEAEHHATLDTVLALEKEGAVVEWVPVDGDGLIDSQAWQATLARSPETIAVASAIAANNEVGTIQNWRELAHMSADSGVPFHLDASAAAGHLDLSLRPATAVSMTGHKIGSVPGVGVLLVDRVAAPQAIIHGGGQQRGLRSGTMDAPAAASFAAALEEVERERARETARLANLRDDAIVRIQHAVPSVVLRGTRENRLDNNINFTFPGCQSDSLLFLLDEQGISVSTGSACQAGVAQPSHVLLAMGLSKADAHSALRITLGHTTTETDLDVLVDALPGVYERALRAGLT
ncbi:MAG: cysteine desulfurase family protein [Actinobacteria bacterium]|nr:cysteine desulfurase family protein [Actinomycetota bacterium]